MNNNRYPTRTDNRYRGLADFINTFDQIFDRSLNPAFPAMMGWPEFSNVASDLQETDDAYVLSLDMPGISKDDIQIQCDGRTLNISAESRQEKSAQGQEGYSRQYRKYQESFTLPQEFEDSKIEANYDNGVLEIMVPKSGQSQAKKISVQSGKGGFLNRLTGKSKSSQQQSATEKH